MTQTLTLSFRLALGMATAHEAVQSWKGPGTSPASKAQCVLGRKSLDICQAVRVRRDEIRGYQEDSYEGDGFGSKKAIL